MEFFQNLLLPLTVTATVVYALIKRLPVFDIFLDGAKKALSQTANLLPTLTALSLAVSMLMSSGGTQVLSQIIKPFTDFFGIPSEVIPLCIISPLSGSGSITVLENILNNHSPDSFIGKTASVIAAAGDTTFYALTVYYGSVGITKTRHTLPSALCADIVSYIAAAFFCRHI